MQLYKDQKGKGEINLLCPALVQKLKKGVYLS